METNTAGHGRPMLGVNVLYTLKWDYRLPFGRMKKKFLREVFDMGPRWRDYLAWFYYNHEFITYEQSVIDALKIIPIDKPGTDDDVYHRWVERLKESLTEDEAKARELAILGQISHKNKVLRNRIEAVTRKTENRIERRDSKLSSAGRLQWYNQGHRARRKG